MFSNVFVIPYHASDVKATISVLDDLSTTNKGLFAKDCKIEQCRSVGKRLCPQAVGEKTARACVHALIGPSLGEILQKNANSLLIVTQDYIHSQGGVWYNRTIAMIFYENGCVCDEAMTDIEVPEVFEPTTAPDVREPDIVGYSESIGERAHKLNGRILVEDWFKAASSTNPTRFQIVCDAILRGMTQLIAPQAFLSNLNIIGNKFDIRQVLLNDKGCKFLSQWMVNQVNAHLGPVRIEIGDPLGAPDHFSTTNWRDTHFLYGIGANGTIVGSILATRLGVSLVTEEADLKHVKSANCIFTLFEFSASACDQLSNAWKQVIAHGKNVVLVLAVVDSFNYKQNFHKLFSKVIQSVDSTLEPAAKKSKTHSVAEKKQLETLVPVCFAINIFS